jgi:hypothetical protein
MPKTCTLHVPVAEHIQCVPLDDGQHMLDTCTLHVPVAEHIQCVPFDDGQHMLNTCRD